MIFISYARSDRQIAGRLEAELRRAGRDCWLDTSEITGGEVWEAAIAEGIAAAPAASLPAFLERQLGELGAHLASLLASRRALLLFDGLNEMPAGERGRQG